MAINNLPNTDTARLNALKKAFEKGRELSPIDLAFSQKSFSKLRNFVFGYEKAVIDYQAAYTNQEKNNKDSYLPKLKKAEVYIIDFIKVTFMAVERGDLQQNTLDFFDLKLNKIPKLTSEDKIFFWGNKIIEGESKRMSLGLRPVTNPTFGVVRVYYNNFVEEYYKQKRLKDNTAYFLNILASMRQESNSLIENIWEQIYSNFESLESTERKNKLIDYGVIFELNNETKTKEDETQKSAKSQKYSVDYSLPFSFL